MAGFHQFMLKLVGICVVYFSAIMCLCNKTRMSVSTTFRASNISCVAWFSYTMTFCWI